MNSVLSSVIWAKNMEIAKQELNTPLKFITPTGKKRVIHEVKRERGYII